MQVNNELARGFRDLELPQPARLAGYAALMETLDLQVPRPRLMRAVSVKQHRLKEAPFQIHPSPHWPGETLAGHLKFALKHEGVNLIVLNAVFREIPPSDIAGIIRDKPTGVFARRLWFLFEWLRGDELPLPDLKTANYALVLDPKLHITSGESERSPRHRLRNNLLGVRDFCPMAYRSRALERWSTDDLRRRATEMAANTPPDVLRRAAAFLLLADSKASFAIEGEQPSNQRLRRWAQIAGRAGEISLSIDWLLELQRIVIGDARAVTLGMRSEGGFIGARNAFDEPVPEHISARHEDLPRLMEGLVAFAARAKRLHVDPIIDAACQAFGFVFIHPFEDGNGRIHRFMIHHVLAERGVSRADLIFPVSAIMEDRILDYRGVLRAVSEPTLPCIDWVSTDRGNVRVNNETIDFYRYFDATPQVEFLYECVEQTIEKSFPEELRFLEERDRFHREATQILDMSERTIDLLAQSLRQNGGKLSKNMRKKHFSELRDDEVAEFEKLYAGIMKSTPAS